MIDELFIISSTAFTTDLLLESSALPSTVGALTTGGVTIDRECQFYDFFTMNFSKFRIFYLKKLYFSVGHGLQPKLPALCQLYRRAFVSYEKLYKSGAKSAKSLILFCSS